MRKMMAAVGFGLAALMTPTVLSAQAAAGTTVSRDKVAIADVKSAIDRSKAWRDASARRAQVYAAQIQQAEAKRAELEQQLRKMIDAANSPAAKKMSSQDELARIRTAQEQGNQEIAALLAPVSRSDAFVVAQINARINDVVRAAMRRNGVSLLITNLDGVISDGGLDLTVDITRELDSVLPQVSIEPPAGWTPPGQVVPGQAAPAPK